ncbi:hypothetical protein GDO78_015203 [Eleutherodactylus coqui]|uniref:Uncharacterized protein n=1 Tax=Eleutherodactylus coqui TaxID=57060 RepID=A0A8J6E6P9_ELECQ|nr:hypothetical protein GDO78_015203 [Eleutherodactylus coqui]
MICYAISPAAEFDLMLAVFCFAADVPADAQYRGRHTVATVMTRLPQPFCKADFRMVMGQTASIDFNESQTCVARTKSQHAAISPP